MRTNRLAAGISHDVGRRHPCHPGGRHEPGQPEALAPLRFWLTQPPAFRLVALVLFLSSEFVENGGAQRGRCSSPLGTNPKNGPKSLALSDQFAMQ